MATPSASTDVLDIIDLVRVLRVLKNNHFPDSRWDDLGFKLGIIQPELNTIRVDKQNSNDRLKKCLSRWLQQDYDINQYGEPTMMSLAAALRGMGLNAVAEGIFEQMLTGVKQPGAVHQGLQQQTGEVPQEPQQQQKEECHEQQEQEECQQQQEDECHEQQEQEERQQQEEKECQELGEFLKEQRQTTSGVSESMTYAGIVYYEVKGVEDLVTFTAAKRLNALLEYIKEYHSDAEMGQNITFRFDNTCDYVELNFNAPQKYPFTGWTIDSHTEPCRLYRRDIDNFGEPNYPLPPSCLLSVYGSPGAVPSLHYSIPLVGVVRPVTLWIHISLRTVPSEIIDLEYLDKAMKEGYIQCSITKAVIQGEARVGKTSLKCALTDGKYKRESTSIIEPSVAVLCYSRDGNKGQYKQISTKGMRAKVKNAVKSKGKDKAATDDIATDKVAANKAATDRITANSTSSQSQVLSKASQETSEATTEAISVLVNKVDTREMQNAIAIVEQFREECKTAQEKGKTLDGEHWLYFIDTGGQIQFQKLLPVFMPFASVLIVVVSLAKSLSAPSSAVAHYKGEDMAFRSNTLTVEEVLKHLFSSIVPSTFNYMKFLANDPNLSEHITFAQHSESSESPLSNKIPPKINIIPVATHGDKCKNDTRLEETKEKLNDIAKCHKKECKFMSNDIHTDILQIDGRIADSEMVIHIPQEQIPTIKVSLDKIARVLYENSYKITVPLKWYCFDVLLHEVASEGCGILTLSFCQELGKELGMSLPEIKNALIFLHLFNKILYYHESKECSDLVFIEVNSLVNILKELVMKVYKGHSKVKTVLPGWCSLVTMGQLTTENMKRVCKDASTREYNDALEHDPNNTELKEARDKALQNFEDFRAQYKNPQFEVKLLKLFQELLIAAVLPSNDYFVPALLPLKDVTHDPHNYPYALPPLLFCFEAAVPMGLFCAIIVHLLSQSCVEWKLNEHEMNYSNYFALKYDVINIILVEQLNCIELHCNDQDYQGIARESVEEAIKSAAEKHSLSINYKKGFYCSCDGAKDGKHIAFYSKIKRKYVIECRNSCDVQTMKEWLESKKHCEIFFGDRDHDTENSSNMRTVTATGVQKSSKRQASVRDMDETVTEETDYHPKRSHLVNDEHTDDISVVAPQSLGIKNLKKILSLLKNGLFNGKWENLGLQLGLYKPTLKNIQAENPRDNDACLRECIAKWLERADGVDSNGGANYVTLTEALEEMEQKNPADYIRENT